jgi:hypothetical protein
MNAYVPKSREIAPGILIDEISLNLLYGKYGLDAVEYAINQVGYRAKKQPNWRPYSTPAYLIGILRNCFE